MKNNFLLGKKPIIDCINSDPYIIKYVHFQNADKDLINDLIKLNIPYQIHSRDNFFKRFNKDVNHQGYALEFKESYEFLKIVNLDFIKKKLLLFKSHPIILMLDEIMDMQNFGAILRTAYAAGVDVVIYKKDNQAQINDYVIKTSMGFITKIPLMPVVNLRNTINELKKIGFWIYSTTLNAKAEDYDKVDYDRPCVIVVGNEKKGVSNIVLNNSDYLIQIPMINKIDSLNVSVATGIILFNIIRNK